MSLVIDASVALSWFFADEASAAAEAALDLVIRNGAVAPPLWRYEVANGLHSALRRQRIDAAYRDQALARLRDLPIKIDRDSDDHAWSTTVALAARHGLTVYDAAYLELAQRRRGKLASLDAALLRAAGAADVPVVA